MPRYAYKPFPYTKPPELSSGGAGRYPVAIVGAGPIGLAAAIDLALHGIRSVVLDDNDVVSVGSRAICWAKRTLEIFDRLGTVPAAAMVRRRLRDLGVTSVPRGPRPATRRHPLGLTERQQEVLELLAEGRSNSEIAERLYVSPKTVEHHVSAILTKLGVPSRAEAVERAAGSGAVQPSK